MPTVRSADGTTIGFEHVGSGPAICLVDGALCYRGAGPMQPLAGLLSAAFTVYTYDRRGRGESSDTPPYAVAREVEDLRAVLAEAGGRAAVYGMSSGGALVMATAAVDPAVTRLALYEPPFMAEVEDGVRTTEYTERLRDLLAAGRDGDAVALFMAHVGVPAPMIDGIRARPGWAALEAVAPTLGYDDAVLAGSRVPRDVAAAIAAPALVLSGGASPAGLQQAARATAAALPAGEHRTLEGQTHDVSPEALAPVLAAFFAAAG